MNSPETLDNLSPTSHQYVRATRAVGSSIGTIFLAGFGFVWLALSLLSFGRAHLLPMLVLIAPVALLIGCAVYCLAKARKLASHSSNSAYRKHVNRSMKWINIAQWSAIISVVLLLRRFHHESFVLPAIILIIGIHFIPIARLFQSETDMLTGVFLIAWACTFPLLLPPSMADTLGAFVTGLVLLACSTSDALVALRLTRSLPSEKQRSGALNHLLA